MNVIEYCTEEVRRQGHDIKALDGIGRVGWMLAAWSRVLTFSTPFVLSLPVIEDIGRQIEPLKNLRGFRTCGVRVGRHLCPSPEEVIPRLERLVGLEPDMTPLEFYKAFEEIHPFVDGNGRTGKILLNWKNGTLLDPIFPPSDLWGEPILNP